MIRGLAALSSPGTGRIVFLDESGLSQRSHRVRTWAPRFQTPVPEFNFNWKLLSAIARMPFGFWNI